MVGPGMLSGLNGLFNFFIGCFVVAILGLFYFVYTLFSKDDFEIISDKKIVPELRLTIKDNKVDTLFVYKLKKE